MNTRAARPVNTHPRSLLLGLLLLCASPHTGAQTAQPTLPALEPGYVELPEVVEERTLSLFGQASSGLAVNGVDYVREDRLNAGMRVGRYDSPRWGRLISVTVQGQTLLLPIEPRPAFAAELNYGVQLGGERFVGHAVTVLRGNVYLPLATLADAFGAEYRPGEGGRFALPAPRLTAVASDTTPEEKNDRIVLELNRPMPYKSSFSGGKLTLELPGVGGQPSNYTTRGSYAKLLTVERVEAKNLLRVSLELPRDVGYRLFPVSAGRGGRSRIVLDLGPRIARLESALSQRRLKPLIVLDPSHGGPDGGIVGPPLEKTVTLEVAREVGRLLSAAGWQVKFTRTSDVAVSRETRSELARRSDLYLGFHLSRFPGVNRTGIGLYRPDGESGLALSDRIRLGGDTRFQSAVAPLVRSQSLSSVLSSSLIGAGFKVFQERAPRSLVLEDAPLAGLNLELGWPQHPQDAARLRDPARLKKLSSAIAGAVATFLTPKQGG